MTAVRAVGFRSFDLCCAAASAAALLSSDDEAEWLRLAIDANPHQARVPELLQHVGGDKARPIVLFCRSGRRASFAKEILRAHGFQRLTNLGSIASWPSH